MTGGDACPCTPYGRIARLLQMERGTMLPVLEEEWK